MLTGTISSISPAVQNGIVTFIVGPEDKADPALRANLRLDVYVVTSFKADVVRVKNGPFYDGIVEQRVFVIEGNTAVGRTVDIGASNFDWVEIFILYSIRTSFIHRGTSCDVFINLIESIFTHGDSRLAKIQLDLIRF